MGSVRISSALALVVVACQAPASDGDAEGTEPRGQTAQAIVNGTPSPATQDATVLVSQGGLGVCTGVLIAPNLVLTARHCVSRVDERTTCGVVTANSAATSLTIALGVYADPRDVVARGARIFLPEANELCGADIALLSLDNDVKNVTPVKVRFRAPAKDDLSTAVGYGDLDDPRNQRTDVRVFGVGPSKATYQTQDGTALPVDLSADEAATSESTCFGDSGGPLFDADGNVIAVASRGIDERCRDRPAIYTTFAGHEALIREAASAAGHPIAEAPASGPPTSTNPAVAGRVGTTPKDAKDDPTADKKSSKGSTLSDTAGCNAGGRPGGAGASLALLALAFVRRRRRQV